MENLRTAIKIATIYMVFGIIWILASDKAVLIMVSDKETYSALSIYKGWFYVLITGFLLFILIKKEFSKLLKTKSELQNNIKELQETEKKRTLLLEEVERKNEELNKFAYTISHDLKSPIITIKGFATRILNDINSGSKDRLVTDINRIIAAADRLTNLIEGVLTLSRIELINNSITTFSLRELLNEVISSLQSLVDENKAIIEIQNNIPEIVGNKIIIGQLFQNLVENSIKFRKSNEPPHIVIGSKLEKGKTVFFVKDNGIGIEKIYQERIFELFDKLNINSEGSGIGLALVKRIVEIHHGEIWIESQEGLGSTFFFTLGTFV